MRCYYNLFFYYFRNNCIDYFNCLNFVNVRKEFYCLLKLCLEDIKYLDDIMKCSLKVGKFYLCDSKYLEM